MKNTYNKGQEGVYLVVALAKELESLGFLVHEDTIQVTSLHVTDLDGLVAPAHYLADADEGHTRWHLAPLQHHVLQHLDETRQKTLVKDLKSR